MPTAEEQIKQLETAVAHLEAQRSVLGDAAVETALEPLRRQLAELRQAVAPAPALSWEGERKPVTVMFADISGFTAMSEKMDPEEVRSLMNACFDRLVPVIEKYEGTVDKFIGDEIMALFGAPVAHENDPERALRAALEMVDVLAVFNAEHGTELALHFGINTGLVVAGGIGSAGRQEYTVIGEAENLAARLEEVSERGEILVGPETYRSAAPLFDFERLSPVRAKGKSEPVAVYRLLGFKTAPDSPRETEGERPPWNGRGAASLRYQTTRLAAEAHIAQLEATTARLEAQRSVLGDAAVEQVLGPLRHRLSVLRKTATLEGERKLVTVMFADITGLAAASEKMASEHVRNLVNACFDHLVPVVERYGGTVDKFIGDKIMALFGAPVAYENHSERALRTALEMVDALAAFNTQYDVSLGLRVGINTGLVIAGGIGSEGRQEYSVMGDAVNLAARLGGASEPGDIFVGPDTHRLTAPLFDFEALAPMSLKGKSEPVPVYRLLDVRAAPGAVRGIEGLRSPVVGRDTELRQLQTAVRRLPAGRGSKVAVVGEAGLGKSRLVAETRQLLTADVTWVEGRALSHTQGMGYWVARDVLRGLLGLSADAPATKVGEALRRSVERLFAGSSQVAPGDLAAEVAEIYPYLALVLDVPLDEAMEERVKYLDAETLQQRIREAFSGYIRAQASEQPLVLVWEDLHWADPSSLHLLEALLPLTDEVPLLLLLILRPDEGRVQPFHRRFVDTYGERYQVIELAPLTHDDGAQLVHNLLNIENLSEETRELILDRAEGNPFYIEELLRSLIDTGVVVLRGDRAVATRAIKEIDVPDTLHGVIMARIDRLLPGHKRALQTASVIGRVFQRRVLAHLLDSETANGRPFDRRRAGPELVEGTPLDVTLDELQQREFIRLRSTEASDGAAEQEYIFKHAMTQDTAYSSLLFAQRKGLHRRAGEAFETLFPDRRDELAATLGYHFRKAEVNGKAFRYFVRAGQRSEATYANEEAIDYFRTALELADEVPEDVSEEKIEIHEHLGDVLVNIGKYDQALEGYTAALDLVGELTSSVGVSARAVPLYRKAGMVYESKGEYPVALEWLTRAQETLGDERSDEMARICMSVAGVLYRQGEAIQALEWCQRGLEIAQETEEQGILAHAYLLRGTIHGDLGDLDHAISDCLRSLDLCQEAGDLLQQAKASNNIGVRYYYKGDWEQAVVHYRQSLEIRERIGDVNGLATVSNNLGELYLNQGRFDEAIESFQRCLETWERIGFLLGVALSYRNLGQVWAKRKKWDRALTHLEASLRILEEMKSRDWLRAEVYRHLAEVCLGLNRKEAAWEYCRRALDIAVTQEIKVVECNARRVLGQLHRCQDQWDDAEVLLRESLRLSEEQGLRYEVGQALWELALLYRDRASAEGRDEDRAQMVEALDRAIAIFEELGAQWDLDRARALQAGPAPG